MPREKYRVVQWATGMVGKYAVQHFVDNPVYELVGVLVTNPEKVGKDAGAIAGLAPTGIIATDDVDAIVALDADCVHYAPLIQDLDVICRLLRSGKNVVTPTGPFYPTDRSRKDVERIEAACRDGGTSFHGGGIHPGYAGDLLPLTLARLVSRIERIDVYEIFDFLRHPNPYIEYMGFGRDPADWLANPSRSPEAAHHLAESMTMVAERLGKTIENVTTKIEVATATKDIPYPTGVIRAGTVAGQRYEWTACSDGAPLFVFYTFWMMGREDIEPQWDCGDSWYRVVIEGDPRTEVSITAGADADRHSANPGLEWTAMACVNAIPDVCDAKPGFITHLDLGIARLRGLVRR